jgi:hypothetical protein
MHSSVAQFKATAALNFVTPGATAKFEQLVN